MRLSLHVCILTALQKVLAKALPKFGKTLASGNLLAKALPKLAKAKPWLSLSQSDSFLAKP